jgi:hypothetical protein
MPWWLIVLDVYAVCIIVIGLAIRTAPFEAHERSELRRARNGRPARAVRIERAHK